MTHARGLYGTLGICRNVNHWESYELSDPIPCLDIRSKAVTDPSYARRKDGPKDTGSQTYTEDPSQ